MDRALNYYERMYPARGERRFVPAIVAIASAVPRSIVFKTPMRLVNNHF
jgi:uncharacterized alpha-E superfamily protein